MNWITFIIYNCNRSQDESFTSMWGSFYLARLCWIDLTQPIQNLNFLSSVLDLLLHFTTCLTTQFCLSFKSRTDDQTHSQDFLVDHRTHGTLSYGKAAKHPHTIILSPPCFTVGMILDEAGPMSSTYHRSDQNKRLEDQQGEFWGNIRGAFVSVG